MSDLFRSLSKLIYLLQFLQSLVKLFFLILTRQSPTVSIFRKKVFEPARKFMMTLFLWGP